MACIIIYFLGNSSLNNTSHSLANEKIPSHNKNRILKIGRLLIYEWLEDNSLNGWSMPCNEYCISCGVRSKVLYTVEDINELDESDDSGE